MDKPYPKVLRTKEDVEFVVNNFPKEIWYEDLKELYYLSRGYYVLGTNPVYKDIETNGVTIKTLSGYEPISDEERADVMEHDDLWENAAAITDTSDTAEFDYKGKHYYAEFRLLEDSVVGQAGIDINWLEDLLFDKGRYDAIMDELDEMQKDLNSMED
jgi:hypothetical protein